MFVSESQPVLVPEPIANLRTWMVELEMHRSRKTTSNSLLTSIRKTLMFYQNQPCLVRGRHWACATSANKVTFHPISQHHHISRTQPYVDKRFTHFWFLHFLHLLSCLLCNCRISSPSQLSLKRDNFSFKTFVTFWIFP